jgi:hypothetical protein
MLRERRLKTLNASSHSPRCVQPLPARLSCRLVSSPVCLCVGVCVLQGPLVSAEKESADYGVWVCLYPEAIIRQPCIRTPPHGACTQETHRHTNTPTRDTHPSSGKEEERLDTCRRVWCRALTCVRACGAEHEIELACFKYHESEKEFHFWRWLVLPLISRAPPPPLPFPPPPPYTHTHTHTHTLVCVSRQGG